MSDALTPRPRWVATSAPYLAARTPGTGDAWAEEAALGGQVGTQRILEAGERSLPTDVRAAFGTADASAILRSRLVLADGVPVEVVDSWWPLTVAAGTPLAEMRKIPGGAPTLLAGLGHVPHRIVEDVAAPRPARNVAEVLGMNPFGQVLEVRRVLYGADGAPFEVTVMHMAPSSGPNLRRVRYEVTLD